MNPLRLLSIAGVGLAGCGPSVWSYTGQYEVAVSESFSSCTGGNGEPTVLSEVTRLEIDQGASSDLLVTVGPCELRAAMGDDGRLEVPAQSCAVTEEPEPVAVTVSGSGVVNEEALNIALSGTFETSQFNYPVECQYALSIVTLE